MRRARAIISPPLSPKTPPKTPFLFFLSRTTSLQPWLPNPYRLLHLSTALQLAKLDRIRAFRGRHLESRSHSEEGGTRKTLRNDSPSWIRRMRRSTSASKRARSPTESPQPDSISPKWQERQRQPPTSAPLSRDHSLTRDNKSEPVPPLAKMPAFLQLSEGGK